MKALIYLLGLIALGSLITWFAFGITPQNQWTWISGYAQNASTEISGHLSETDSSAKKLGNVLDNRFKEASDVFHGNEKQDPFQYNPTEVDGSKIKQ